MVVNDLDRQMTFAYVMNKMGNQQPTVSRTSVGPACYVPGADAEDNA
jgi:hypothetical protein